MASTEIGDAGHAVQQDAGPAPDVDARASQSSADAAPSLLLRVGVAVEAGGSSADGATVAFGLKVVDAASGAPILDATVTGGLAGAMTPLVADPSDPGSYGGQRTGYSNPWEFSIARGGAPMWDVTLTGPSFPATACAIDWYANPPVLTVDWAPSAEPGVASDVTVTQTIPAPAVYHPPTSWNILGHDEGNAAFRIAPDTSDRYAIVVGLTMDRSFDWGEATIGVSSQTSTVACQ